MRILVRSYSRSNWHGDVPVAPRIFSGLLLRSLMLLRGAVSRYVIEYRSAKAAQELYRHLSSLSDAELARRGLERRQLPQLVRDRCY
jgi:hypothetical protein